MQLSDLPDPTTPATPLWHLHRLAAALDQRQKDVAEAEAWYDGNHPVPLPPPGTFAEVNMEARIAFLNMSKLAITNLLPPIVNVPAAKLGINGFRFGASDTGTDNQGWTIFQRNGLDARNRPANKETLKVGSTPVLIWPDAKGKAVITVEDPSQAIISYRSGTGERWAALKRWQDDSGYVFATLYQSDFTYKFKSTQTFNSQIQVSGQPAWQIREVPDEAWPLPTPEGLFPMHELQANPGLKFRPFGGGMPEFEGQLNEQRKLNGTVFDLLTTMEHQAHRQRYAIGWDYPTNPDGTPNEAAIKKAAASSLWLFKNKDAALESGITVGEFQQAQLDPFLNVIKTWLMVMCATSSTPHYAFQMGDMVNVAADLLARIDAAQNAKVVGHQDELGQPWQAIISHALTLEGSPLGEDMTASVIWSPVTSTPDVEAVQVAQGMHDLGVPDAVVFARLPGANQQDAARWVAENAKNAAKAELAAPAPSVPPPTPLPVP